jgi:hypothetical protein
MMQESRESVWVPERRHPRERQGDAQAGGRSDSTHGWITHALLRLILTIPLLLAIDSPYGDAITYGHGQLVADLMVLLGFIYFYRRRSRRIRKIMLIGMVVGLAIEFLASIVLGAYHYRYGNIPLWIAFGHGLIYASSFRLSRHRWLRSREMPLQFLLTAFAVLYCLLLLFRDNDWFGFVCGIGFFLVLLHASRSRFFFLIMFAIVAYIEQIGTLLGTWHWEPTAFGVSGWLPSGNPPSGIAIGYFAFEFAVLWIYLNIFHPKTKQRYLALARSRT